MNIPPVETYVPVEYGTVYFTSTCRGQRAVAKKEKKEIVHVHSEFGTKFGKGL